MGSKSTSSTEFHFPTGNTTPYAFTSPTITYPESQSGLYTFSFLFSPSKQTNDQTYHTISPHSISRRHSKVYRHFYFISISVGRSFVCLLFSESEEGKVGRKKEKETNWAELSNACQTKEQTCLSPPERDHSPSHRIWI